MKRFVLSLVLFPLMLTSQEDLLSSLDSTVVADKTVVAAFKGLKVVNFESTKLASDKAFYFVVAHRFGTVKNGFEDFFGLDNAVTQLKFIYGINDWLNVGAARSSFQKSMAFI